MTTIILAVGVAFNLAFLGARFGSVNLPGNHQGYEPAQPLAFSHLLHSGEMNIDCLYCHSGAESSRHAGIPSAGLCMNCHESVRATLGAVRAEEEAAAKEKRPPRPIVSPELAKLFRALGRDDQQQEGLQRRPLEWVQVHNLPDFVYFDHRAHVNAGVNCQRCHGPVETMQRVRQTTDLSMGWCVNCHRQEAANPERQEQQGPSIDCGVCHR